MPQLNRLQSPHLTSVKWGLGTSWDPLWHQRLCWCWPYQPLGLAWVRVQTSPAGMEREGKRKRPGMTHGSMQWVPSWSWGNTWCAFTLHVNANALKHVHMLSHTDTPTDSDLHAHTHSVFLKTCWMHTSLENSLPAILRQTRFYKNKHCLKGRKKMLV